ncbi:MAG: type I methionyl aminopeptidase [Firmicutes bacterium]|nr:type I methionyl aminopeptidase [Bacillota bacterium]MBR0179486.1 type I methionyl aminopeptidase [Bacillota bacterium]
MIVTTQTELDALREIGRICAETLKIMADALEPGITTKELDAIGADYLARHGAQSAPITCYDFPGCNCISVNDVVAHGIPSDQVIKAGDVVNIDVSAVKDGFFSDNGASYALPPVKKQIQELLRVTKSARDKAIAQAVAGRHLNEIGRAAEKEAHRHGLTTIKNLCGHGVGHTLHDDPDAIFSYYERRDRRKLKPGVVIAIEPFLCDGDEYVEDFGNDGWTLKTPRRLIVAQYEHTIMVREDQPPLILTALD